MELLMNHITAIRKLPGLQNAFVVFIPESNYAFEATHQARELKNYDFRHVCVMQEDDNRAGVRTSNEFKKLMALTFMERVHKKKIRCHRQFVSLYEKSTPEETKESLLDQLCTYCRIIRPSKDIYKPATETFSGKRGVGFDDMAIAAQLIPVMKKRFFQRSDKYKRWQ